MAETTKPLLEKLGVKPGAKVALVDVKDAWFVKMLRERTQDITQGKPRTPCDLVFMTADTKADLARLRQVKTWIEPNGAVWVIRLKGGRGQLKDTDMIDGGLAAGLVDNKIASFSDTQGAMRFVFRLRDRPR